MAMLKTISNAIATSLLTKLPGAVAEKFTDVDQDEFKTFLEEFLKTELHATKTKGAKKEKKEGPSRTSGFLLYSADHRQQVKDDNEGITFGQVGKMLGEQWKALDDEERQEWNDKAATQNEDNGIPPAKSKTPAATANKKAPAAAANKKAPAADAKKKAPAADAKKTAADKKAADAKKTAADKKAADAKKTAADKKAADAKKTAADKKAADAKKTAADKKAADAKKTSDTKAPADPKKIAITRNKDAAAWVVQGTDLVVQSPAKKIVIGKISGKKVVALTAADRKKAQGLGLEVKEAEQPATAKVNKAAAAAAADDDDDGDDDDDDSNDEDDE